MIIILLPTPKQWSADSDCRCNTLFTWRIIAKGKMAKKKKKKCDDKKGTLPDFIIKIIQEKHEIRRKT